MLLIVINYVHCTEHDLCHTTPKQQHRPRIAINEQQLLVIASGAASKRSRGGTRGVVCSLRARTHPACTTRQPWCTPSASSPALVQGHRSSHAVSLTQP